MQPFAYPQNQTSIQYLNPSTSKALMKLKNDKLIPANQVNYQSTQPIISYPPKNLKPIINYNGIDSSLRNSQSLSKNQSMVLRRQQSNNSGVGLSQSSQLTMSQHSNAYTQPSFPQPIQTLQYQPSQPVISMNNQNMNEIMSQPSLKPLSAFNRTNNISTNGETRVRSNSANITQNLKFNQDSENRLLSLENKLNDFNQQIISTSTKLNEKQVKITELQRQLSFFKNKSSQFEIKVQQFGQKTPYLQKKVKQLQAENQKIKSSKLEIEEQNQKNMEKVMTLQSNLDKILQIKNHQIQSLNQSCAQLGKNCQQLHQKYSAQIRQLTQKNQSQSLSLKQNKNYFENLATRIKQLQTHSETKQKDSRKINEQAMQIQNLYSQNSKLKFQLDTTLEQLSLIKANYLKERQQTLNAREQLYKVTNDYENAKGIGQQQLQFLQSKIKEAALEKQRLLEQIQLTKAITHKRNMIFQRKIIYELKTENDRLWAKLIDKSEDPNNFRQNDLGYLTVKNATHSRKPSHKSQISVVHPVHPTIINPIPHQVYKQKQKVPYHELEEQYRKFVEHLQQQQRKAQEVIGNLNHKQAQNKIQDVEFYKRKCINLQQMVEQHLKINISLKQQLQRERAQVKADVIKPAEAEVIFMKSQLEKQQLIYNTLQRTFDLFKIQYELKFKSAQARVDQIENQQDKSFSNVEEIKKQLSAAHFQILKLSNQNFAMKNKLQQSPSQQTKYQNLYLELKSKMEKGSPISHFTLKQSNHEERGKKQMEVLKKQYQKKQQQYQTLSMVHQQNCQAYEQQLKMKENEIDILRREMDKLSFQFQSAKIRYGPMLNDIDRLQRQLSQHKKGAMFVDKRMATYYTSLIRAKLLEFDAFLKQIIEINRDSRGTQSNNVQQSIKLIQNSQKAIQNCVTLCSQLEVNIRQ